MAVASVQKFLSNKRNLVVLTGAGISTESGIPDYRSPGRPPYVPMQHKLFIDSAEHRKRYWSRSMVGYPRMMFSPPNLGHRAIAKAEHEGVVKHVMTQNVDGLHQLAGSQQVLELHGSLKIVACLNCKKEVSRAEVQRQLAALNPSYAELALQHVAKQLPDGDIGIEADLTSFKVPDCPACGGVLKPAIVFFGDNLPRNVSQKSTELAQECDGLLVVGSSLTVQSAFRLVKIALRHPPFGTDKPPADVFIVNDGPTRADSFIVETPAHVHKISVRAGELLSSVFGTMENKGEEQRKNAHPSGFGGVLGDSPRANSSFWLP